LVGATDLPSSAELSLETIQINYGAGSPDSLSYELSPNNTLTVTASIGRVGDKALERKATFALSSEHAWRARRMLWRLRPPTLEGAEYLTRLPGCDPKSVHDFGEAVVTFINEHNRSAKNAQVGIVVLPNGGSCDTPGSKEARSVVRQISQVFREIEAQNESKRMSS
jgi:hypothetical protein